MVTMRDVADVMGVSVMTVSNAFNRPDQLSPDLRRRILDRAGKMGYGGPHAGARALRQGRTNAYGVVFADSLGYAFADPFTVEWLRGFADAMTEHRSSIVLMSVPSTDADGLEAIRNTSVDGIATACAVHPVTDAARAHRIPVVAGDCIGDTYVSIDEFAAGSAMGRHAVDLGHRRVWVLLGATGADTPDRPRAVPVRDYLREQPTDGTDTWHRYAGILDALAGAEVTILEAVRWDRADGAAAAALALDRPDRPSFVLALSDNLALGFIEAMRSRGLEPGRDISVSGFDDIAEAAAAGLTTIRQPIYEKGRRSAQLLLDPGLQPRRVTLPHTLVVRQSTTPLPPPED